jgi:hypothetical protein
VPEAFKLTRLVSLKGKFNSPFLFSQNHAVLLRHVALSDEMVMPSKTGPLGGLARSVVDYVIIYYIIAVFFLFKYYFYTKTCVKVGSCVKIGRAKSLTWRLGRVALYLDVRYEGCGEIRYQIIGIMVSDVRYYLALSPGPIRNQCAYAGAPPC